VTFSGPVFGPLGILPLVTRTASRPDGRSDRLELRRDSVAGAARLSSVVAFCLLLAPTSCSQPGPLEDRAQDRRVDTLAEAPRAHSSPEPEPSSPPEDPVEAVPVPPADGALIAPIVNAAPVFARPEKGGERIGYLRIGARVARSEEPVSLKDCSGGWYAVRPVGFACAGDDLSTSLEHPLARAIGVEPDRSKPMPYSYAFTRAASPNYLKVPSSEEQFQYEERLARHLADWKKLGAGWEAPAVGANDVPLGADGLPLGPALQPAPAVAVGARFGGDGTDQIPWWLDGDRQIDNIATFGTPRSAVFSDHVQRHAGVSLIGSFVTGAGAQRRRFAITTDARLLPADKLELETGSAFHGASLRELGLPAAFTRREGVRYWSVSGSQLVRGDRLGQRELVPLSGKVQTLGEERLVETRDGRWLKSSDLKIAAKPRKLPRFAEQGLRWIDVSINHQTLVLWEGEQPVYLTLVSTGKDGLGDPETTMSTPLGTFTIQQKHITHTMDSREADTEFELRDVPWVMYFKGGYALHGAYWHDDFGRPRSHGCVNLAPIDARYVFEWSLPDVPEHWHGVYSGQTFGGGTVVRIRQ
jgi:L,D-transpeptidase-like protein